MNILCTYFVSCGSVKCWCDRPLVDTKVHVSPSQKQQRRDFIKSSICSFYKDGAHSITQLMFLCTLSKITLTFTHCQRVAPALLGTSWIMKLSDLIQITENISATQLQIFHSFVHLSLIFFDSTVSEGKCLACLGLKGMRKDQLQSWL